MLSTHLLSSVVDEILQLSDSPPSVVSALRVALIEHYEKATIMASDDYREPIKKLYSIDDNELYTLVSLCFVDEYSYFLIPAADAAPHKTVRKFIAGLKSQNSYAGVEIMEMVTAITKMTKAIHEIIADSTRTTRRAIESSDEEDSIELPDMQIMEAFYKCGRKARYSSIEEAKADLATVNDVYKCDFCGELHQGRQPTGESIPQYIMEGRYRTAWRRYNHV